MSGKTDISPAAVRTMLKRIGSTPFPEGFQGIADDAEVMIYFQAARITDLEAENAKLRAALGRVARPEAFYVATSNIDPEALARMIYSQAILGGLALSAAEETAEREARKRQTAARAALEGKSHE